MKSIDLILFDLGNVLVTYTPSAFWSSLGLSTPAQQKPFVDPVRALSAEYERGAIATTDFFLEAEKLFGGSYTTVQLERAFGSVLTAPVQGMEDLLKIVQKQTRTALVSNTNPFHWDYCRKNIRSLGRIQSTYLSFRMRVLKPETMFYARVLKAERLPAGMVLFVDDMGENIAGAKRAGMRVHQFRTAELLRGELEEFGIR